MADMASPDSRRDPDTSPYTLGPLHFEFISSVSDISTLHRDHPLFARPSSSSQDSLLSTETTTDHNTARGEDTPRPSSQSETGNPTVDVEKSPPEPVAAPRKRDWLLEFVALIISIASLCSLFGVLGRYDGVPMDAWSGAVSLNTIVSILSITMKTPLAFVIGSCLGQGKWTWFRKRQGPVGGFAAFDEASRGPLGSLMLLWRFKSQHWASLGAWVTLALLAVDPFLQAVIMYPGKSELSHTGASTATRASGLDIGDWFYQSMAIMDYNPANNPEPRFLKAYRLLPDVNMSATTLIGFVSSTTSTSLDLPPVTCNTANCSWPIFSSLGICSSCLDVSDKVFSESKQGMPDESPLGVYSFMSTKFVANYTKYVIPYGRENRLVLERVDGLYDQGGLSPLDPRVSIDVAFSPWATYNFKESDSLLAAFVILQAEDGYWDRRVPWQKAAIKAKECAFEFCTRVYQTEVRYQMVHENPIAHQSRRVPTSFKPGEVTNQTKWKAYDSEFGNSLAASHFPRTMEEKSSGLGGFTFLLPRNDLQLEILAADDEVSPVFNITQKSIVTWQDYLGNNDTITQITFALSTSANLTKTFENTAKLLTNRMRELNGTQVVGTESRWVVYIRIRWGFLAFPVISAVAGLCFAIGAVWESRKLDLPTMKTDALAMLLHGLDSDTTALLREKNGDGKAEDIQVRLENGSEGLKLRSGEQA